MFSLTHAKGNTMMPSTMSDNQRGLFITVEGIEGVGKSTAMHTIELWLEAHNHSFVLTREPGGTPIAEAIRQVFLAHYDEEMSRETETLLLFASRAQHLGTVIKPALAAGQWVVCDRFTDASYAYQGAGRGVDKNRLEVLEQWVQGDMQPDLTILLDAPAELALERTKSRGAPDRIEQEHIQFFEKIRAAYLERAQAYPERFRVFDASQPLPTVNDHIYQALAQFAKESIRC